MNSEDRRLEVAEEDASEHFHRDWAEIPAISSTTSRPRSPSGPQDDQDRQSIYRVETKQVQQPSKIAASDWCEGTLESQIPSLNRSTGGSPSSSGTDVTLPQQLPSVAEYIVEFDGSNDPTHPQNWPSKKKIWTAVFLGFAALSSSFGSSVFSACVAVVAAEFGVSSEVTILGVSLYVLGFATGPIVWAPFSELYGRKTPLIVGSFLFGIFNIATAVGKDLQSILICRFFSGFMASSAFTVVPGVYADIFDNRFRGTANALFSVAVFCGPLLSPFIGGIIVASGVTWRWTAYITAIMGFLSLFFQLLSLDETYPPVVLVHKADRLRRETKNWAWHAKQEELELSLEALWEKNLSRPIRMLFTEPIVLCLSVYVAFIYALLYLFLELYPAIFRDVYGMRQGVAELTYFGMIVGQVIAGLLIVLEQPSYNKKLIASNNVPVPEWRLPFAMAGGIAFPVGLFWLSWTGYTGHIHWIVPTLSGLLTGFGILTIFQQCLNYLIDAYLKFAASAVAANTFLRSFLAAGSPLFANYMINGLGVQWAGTLLGCVAFLLMPMPFLFYYKGPAIRAKSSFKTENGVSEKGTP